MVWWESIFLYEFNIVYINKVYDNDYYVVGIWVNCLIDLDWFNYLLGSKLCENLGSIYGYWINSVV